MFITKEQVKLSFDKGAYQRGEKYFFDGNVEYAKYDKNSDSFNASVKGNGRTYYLNLNMGLKIFSVCSCPVAYQCKHGVAVALSIIHEFQNDELEDQSLNGTDPATNNVIKLFSSKKETDFEKWLNKAKKTSSIGNDEKNDSSNLEPLSYILDKKDRGYANFFVEAKRLTTLKSGKKARGPRFHYKDYRK